MLGDSKKLTIVNRFINELKSAGLYKKPVYNIEPALGTIIGKKTLIKERGFQNDNQNKKMVSEAIW